MTRTTSIALSVALLVLLATLPASPAAPPVSGIDARRVGDGLEISWGSAPGALGYRVYRSRDPRCVANWLLYDGPATRWTEVDAFLDPQPALYRVTAYDATGEGEPTTPVYKYSVALPKLPLLSPGAIVSLPPSHGVPDARELCLHLNHWPGPGPMIVHIIQDWTELGGLPGYNCEIVLPAPGFSLRPGRAYRMTPRQDGDLAYAWGHGHPLWSFDFSAALSLVDDGHGGFRYLDLYWVSLPWDHDYADLAAIAADIPGALEVRVFDPLATAAPYGIGLTRPTRFHAWGGRNVALDTSRGQGVMIGVDAATTWVPRRLCVGPIPVPHGGPAEEVPQLPGRRRR